MEELEQYQGRMGYTEESMRNMRYKMSVYDDFTEEYDYRMKYAKSHQAEAQREQVVSAQVQERGRRR